MIDESVLKTFRNSNVLITGGTGMIGRQIVKILCEAGAHVKIVSMDRLTVHPSVEHIFGDLTDFKFCKEITKEKGLRE